MIIRKRGKTRMPFTADVLALTLLLLLSAVVIGIVAYAIAGKAKARRETRNVIAIRAVILDYFRRSGVEVTVDCGRLNANSRFTAVVESEPMKRFRLSHIIEMTVREHVRKACGLELDKIYWRFPIKESAQSAAVEGAAVPAGAAKRDENSDEYINEGLEHYRHIPKPEVEELPWEHFEQVATAGLAGKNESN
jgi:hypothetical protein